MLRWKIDDCLHVELLCNDQVYFEILKMKIRSVSIAYSIKKSRDEKEKNIKTWEWHTNFRKSNEFESYRVYSGIFESEKGEIRKSEQDIVEGLLLRSRANWHENGERCSEYFCKLEKKVLYQQNHFWTYQWKR